MDIMEMKVGDAVKLSSMFGQRDDSHPWVEGKCYLIRTCTMTLTGRLVRVHRHELVLSDASWIADTGRFGDAISKGVEVLREVEPMGDVIIGRGSIVDAVEWAHPLPTEQK